MKSLESKNIIVLAHVITTVPAQDLKEYFISHKVKNLMFIAHPLFYVDGRPGAYYELYEKGEFVKKIEYKNRKFPSIVQYLKDYFLTLFWVLKQGKKWDLIISLDNLNTFSALTLKSIGIINKVIYYTIDFVPERFGNKPLNAFYHYIEKISVGHADKTWNLSDRVAKGREDLLDMKRSVYDRQVTIPIGVWFNRIPRKKFQDIDSKSIVYAGGLLPHQGVQLVIGSLPLIIKKIPNVKFIIVGIGSYEMELKKKVKELKLTKQVKFLGYIEKHQDVEKILSECGLAVAMYSEELSKWSYYGDPSKVKAYVASGLPVITTSLTQISEELEKRKCGIVSQYNEEDLAEKIVSVFNNPKRHEQMRENAIKFASSFDWNQLLDKAIREI